MPEETVGNYCPPKAGLRGAELDSDRQRAAGDRDYSLSSSWARRNVVRAAIRRGAGTDSRGDLGWPWAEAGLNVASRRDVRIRDSACGLRLGPTRSCSRSG